MPHVQGWVCPFRDHVKHTAAEVGSAIGCVPEIQPASSAYRPKQVMESEKEACKCFSLCSAESLWSCGSGWFYAWWFVMFLHAVGIIPFFILATCDCEHINTSIHKFTVFGWAHNLENTFLFICALFAKWFRGSKIYCKDKNLFPFQEERNKHGFSSGKVTFRRWQIWVGPLHS